VFVYELFDTGLLGMDRHVQGRAHHAFPVTGRHLVLDPPARRPDGGPPLPAAGLDGKKGISGRDKPRGQASVPSGSGNHKESPEEIARIPSSGHQLRIERRQRVYLASDDSVRVGKRQLLRRVSADGFEHSSQRLDIMGQQVFFAQHLVHITDTS
jgi:hypothetical protein